MRCSIPVLTGAYDALSRLPVWLCEEAVSIADVTRLVEHWPFTPPLSLVIVDYLQLVRAPRDIRERRHQVEYVSQALKTLAVKCRLPILCLSSLSRAEQGNRDRKPMLSDLRESGELEHDADVILLMHRGFGEEETEIAVAKNRNGRVGVVTILFRSDFVAFDNQESA